MTKEGLDDVEIGIELKPRSLLILKGEARREWMHEIKRKDVTCKRIATTFRELSSRFLPSSQDDCLQADDEYQVIGRQLIDIGSKYV